MSNEKLPEWYLGSTHDATLTGLAGLDATAIANLASLAAAGGQEAQLVRKEVTFDGTAGLGGIGTVALFTVTGLVKLTLYAICTADLTEEGAPGGATIEVGMSGDTAALIAQTAALNIDNGEIWHDATPDASHELASVAPTWLINGEDIIATIGTDEVNGGTLVFLVLATPLSAGAAIVGA